MNNQGRLDYRMKMSVPTQRLSTQWPLYLLLLMILPAIGCGAIAQLMYVVQGHEDPAEFEGLEKQRVAVVCISDASSYGPDKLTTAISNVVGLKLATYGKDIEIVPQRDLDRWVDENGWDEADFVSLGRGVGAQKVLVIDIASYSIHEGRTIYKGRTDMTAKVLDVANNGQVEYIHGPEYFEFPRDGRPAIQMSDREFESIFLAKLTDRIGKRFYAHDRLESVAEDASMLSF